MFSSKTVSSSLNFSKRLLYIVSNFWVSASFFCLRLVEGLPQIPQQRRGQRDTNMFGLKHQIVGSMTTIHWIHWFMSFLGRANTTWFTKGTCLAASFSSRFSLWMALTRGIEQLHVSYMMFTEFTGNHFRQSWCVYMHMYIYIYTVFIYIYTYTVYIYTVYIYTVYICVCVSVGLFLYLLCSFDVSPERWTPRHRPLPCRPLNGLGMLCFCSEWMVTYQISWLMKIWSWNIMALKKVSGVGPINGGDSSRTSSELASWPSLAQLVLWQPWPQGFNDCYFNCCILLHLWKWSPPKNKP